MANIESHAPGSFCWIELGTTDQQAAKTFYAKLFGWNVNEFPMGPGETYSVFQLNGRDTGGGYTLRKDQRDQGVPPHWMLFIAVQDAESTVAKVTKAGGKVVMPAIGRNGTRPHGGFAGSHGSRIFHLASQTA